MCFQNANWIDGLWFFMSVFMSLHMYIRVWGLTNNSKAMAHLCLLNADILDVFCLFFLCFLPSPYFTWVL